MKRRVVAVAGLLLMFSGAAMLLVTGSPERHARADEGDIRGWTDVTGRFNLQAALIEVKDGNAVLQRDSGENVSVPLTRLSREDQQYVREELARRRGARQGRNLPSPCATAVHRPRPPTNGRNGAGRTATACRVPPA
jgi:hypothetical protein